MSVRPATEVIPSPCKTVIEASPSLEFGAHPSTARFAVSPQTYLSQHPGEGFDYLATGALVFDNQIGPKPRILLLQRSAEDSMPHRWEVPGGACDDEDETIMHGLARELWEETSLKSAYIERALEDAHFFTTTSGKKICKIIFVVQPERNGQGQLNVKLNPKEHQRFVWASQDEIKAKAVGNIELSFAHQELENAVIQSFGEIPTLVKRMV